MKYASSLAPCKFSCNRQFGYNIPTVSYAGCWTVCSIDLSPLVEQLNTYGLSFKFVHTSWTVKTRTVCPINLSLQVGQLQHVRFVL